MSFGPCGTTKYEKVKIVNNFDDFIAFLVECGLSSILCSSSMDFPEEYTDDPKIIALCEKIRSA